MEDIRRRPRGVPARRSGRPSDGVQHRGEQVSPDRGDPLQPGQGLRAARADARRVRPGEVEGKAEARWTPEEATRETEGQARMTSKAATRAANRVGARYLALIRRFPLRPLRSDAELDHAIGVANQLID